ncbi:MAG: ferredoxin family protein [Clostridiales Family XIII bacterium]|jgi:NAD-dependent dihydropyrimidine dehydrogenase PreA subunit|nr:ferredoxin family protein [Clostridiales Family XIII bacterium]
MAHTIDRDKCTNCLVCYDRCPEDVYALDEKGIVCLKRPEECWLCGGCQIDCPHGAIKIIYDINQAPVFIPN